MIFDQVIETEVFPDMVVVHGGTYEDVPGERYPRLLHQWKIVDPKKSDLMSVVKNCGFTLPYERNDEGHTKNRGQLEFEVAWTKCIWDIVKPKIQEELDRTGVMRFGRVREFIIEEERGSYELCEKELDKRALEEDPDIDPIDIINYYWHGPAMLDGELAYVKVEKCAYRNISRKG